MKRLTSLIALGCLSLSLEALAADPAAPGKVFKDCKDCPEMVVLPAGSYVMGTPMTNWANRTMKVRCTP